MTEEELNKYVNNHSLNGEDVLLPTPKYAGKSSVYTRSYNESIALSNENNFVNIAGRYYGGDQRWLDRSLSNTGCGVVAAAN